MATICMLTTAHNPFDDRIFYREAVSLAKKHRVILVAPGDGTRMVRGGVEVITVPRRASRLARFTVTAAQVIGQALRAKADICHFHDPDLLPWMALLALTGKTVVYDVHEYYGYSIQTAQWLPSRLRKPIATLVDRMEKAANRTFAGTVTVNRHMEQLFSPTSRRTVTISNYPLPWLIEQTRSADGGQPASCTILYAGGLNLVRGYRLILDTMKIVHARHPEFMCDIIGWPDYTGMDVSVPRLGDDQTAALGIRYTPVVPFTEMPLHLKRAGVCWLPWQRTPNHERGTPVKLFEYMASGRPVVCSEMGIISSVVNETGCGILVPPDDPEAHAEALIRMLTHPDEAGQMGARGRECVMSRYNWTEEEKKLLAFYDALAQAAGVNGHEHTGDHL